MVIIFIFSVCAMAFLLYSFYKFWKEDCEDLREAIFRVRSKETLIFLVVGWLMWFSFTTLLSMISDQHLQKNETITSIEHSLSSNCDTIINIKKPTTTYGIITKIRRSSYPNGKIMTYEVDVEVKLNDGRIMQDIIKGSKTYGDKSFKEGRSMSVTETYYPTYMTQFNY